jgi:3-polyprenyl-4-hydroxybenzoate decarboxylase
MGLRGGAPVEIAKVKTVDLDVPARAEFVIQFEADFTRQVMPNGRKVPAGRDAFGPVQVALKIKKGRAFRMQPPRDLIVVDVLPGGTLDPSVDRSMPLDKQTGEGMGIDATFPFGGGDPDRGSAARQPRHLRPGAAQNRHEYIEVADAGTMSFRS